MAIAVRHGDDAAGGRGGALRGARARLPRLPRVRARARRATRSTPTAPTCSSTGRSSPSAHRSATEAERADVADFLADLATGNGQPALLAGDDQPQDRVPALLLPPPAPRGARRRGSDGVAQPAREEPQASSRPHLRGGQAPPRERVRRRSDRSFATGPCSRSCTAAGCGPPRSIGPGRQRHRPAPRRSCARTARGTRSASSRSAARRRPRSSATCGRAGPSWSARGP